MMVLRTIHVINNSNAAIIYAKVFFIFIIFTDVTNNIN